MPASTTPAPVHASAPAVTRDAASLRLSLPRGVSITVALEGDLVRGVRDVAASGVPLRNPRSLWRPVFFTAKGVQYTRLVLRETRTLDDGGVALVLDAVGAPVAIHEEHDEYLCDLFDLRMGDDPIVDRLEWEFRPCLRTFGGVTFAGFSYQYRFAAAPGSSRELYRLFDHATWEVGGAAAGNRLILQGQCNPPVADLTLDHYFTTACNYYGAEMRGAMDPNARVSFQRLPRIGTIQPFDFLAHERGTLLGVFEPTEEILTLVQKNVGENCLHVLDEHRRPLGATFETRPKLMLFALAGERCGGCAAGRVSPEPTKNLWWSVYEAVQDAARARFGIERSPVQPRIWIPQIGEDTATIQGRQMPRERFLYDLADNLVPVWADMGVKEICTHSMWVSDYTLDRFKTKQDTHLHGGLTVGSICNMRELKIDPLWGGPEALAYFTKACHAHGMQVQVWWATHMSRRADVYKENPSWMMLGRDGHANGGGFGRQSIITMNLNAPGCLDWVVSRFQELREKTGIDGIFHDSYGNMTFLPMNFNDPLRRGQQEAYEKLVVRLQKIGVKTFTVEGIGPFGVGHFGMNLLPPDFKMYGKGYQYALDWWLGHEDMIYGLNMGIGSKIWPEQNHPEQFSFRAMASGGRFAFTQYEGGIEKWTGWLREQNRLHARISPIRGRRELLEEGRGVVWHTDAGRLLFAYAGFELPLPAGTKVSRVEAESDVPVTPGPAGLGVEAWKVYRISK
ncbi:MAG: hypothetical protein NTW19_18260 [Planctomycetota bacterium]|nr:hypothetical protein [Planctomycetota bacterium]